MGKKIKTTLSGLKQYTKQILTVIIIAWLLGGIIGIAYEFIRLMVSPETACMDGLYTYLAVPLSCGLPSYIIPNLFLKKEEVRTGRYYGSDTETDTAETTIELQ